jgi:hypothetical protein
MNKMETLREGDDIDKGGVKFDGDKVMMELLPVSFLWGVAAILTYGAKKYAARNWEKGMDWSRPYAGCLRHLFKWWSGETIDPESGLPHLHHAACNLAFLIEYETKGTGTDDRPGER